MQIKACRFFIDYHLLRLRSRSSTNGKIMANFVKYYVRSVVLAGALFSSATSSAANNGVVSGMGHGLAERLCTMCHLVEPGATNPPGNVGGPAFQDVANQPDITEKSLRRHLRTTHSNSMIPLAMPDPQLTEDEVIKIIDYILSLKTQPSKASAR
jgi:hypothetical protein